MNAKMFYLSYFAWASCFLWEKSVNWKCFEGGGGERAGDRLWACDVFLWPVPGSIFTSCQIGRSRGKGLCTLCTLCTLLHCVHCVHVHCVNCAGRRQSCWWGLLQREHRLRRPWQWRERWRVFNIHILTIVANRLDMLTIVTNIFDMLTIATNRLDMLTIVTNMFDISSMLTRLCDMWAWLCHRAWGSDLLTSRAASHFKFCPGWRVNTIFPKLHPI